MPESWKGGFALNPQGNTLTATAVKRDSSQWASRGGPLSGCLASNIGDGQSTQGRMSRKSKFLLDVNTLVALFDEAHIHHIAAHEWFALNGVEGWVTCPITENGLLRIISHPAYPNSPLPMADLAERLEEFKKAAGNYSFWSNDYSLSEWLSQEKLPIGSAHSTDAYLLKLCKRNGGALATFDRRIKPSLIGEKLEGCLEYIPS